MPLKVQWPGAGRLAAQLRVMATCDCEPLMEQWARTLIEGSRRGVLAGLDGNNQPMPPLKYRNGAGKATKNRRLPFFGTNVKTTPKTGRFVFTGPYASGFDLNPSAAEYRQLTGPRLAPRRDGSRVITHLYAEPRHPTDATWEAVAAWRDVVSRKGFPFLAAHFEGTARLPKYDLRPVRPEDFAMCLNQLRAFARAAFFERLP